VSPLRFPWETEAATASPGVAAGGRELAEGEVAEKQLGRRPLARSRPVPGAGLDWLYHQLTITGSEEKLAAFAAAARGSGVIPWRLDFNVIEEDIFNMAVAQPLDRRSLDVRGCRLLARQFRERVEAREGRAAALIGNSLACPFDFQILCPIPEAILELGRLHQVALAWLRTHWGTADRLHQIKLLAKPGPGRRLPAGHSVVGYEFLTPDAPPAPAISAIAACWPDLRFRLRHRPTTWDHGWIS
jgi:hypothetical protein